MHCVTGGADYIEFLEVVTTLEFLFSGNRRRRRAALGDEMQCVPVSVIGDERVENDEDFFLTLTTDDPDIILLPDEARVTIKNDDGMFIHTSRYMYLTAKTGHDTMTWLTKTAGVCF